MYNFAEADTWSVCRDRVVNDCGKIIFILLSFSGSLAPSSRVLDRLTYDKQVCVQLPTYAENVALPTFAAERCAVAPCFCGAGRTAVDRYGLSPACIWDRRTPYRFIDPAPHMRTVPIKGEVTFKRITISDYP